MTLLAVPIAADTLEDAKRLVCRAQAEGAELLELRLDLLPAGAEGAMPPQASLPVLATCRDPAEGGSFRGDDAGRAQVLQLAALTGADYVDFEMAAWNRSPKGRAKLQRVTGRRGRRPDQGRAVSCKLVLSAHDFAGLPAALASLVNALWDSPADIAKIAYTANRITDCFAALDILHQAEGRKPTIALAMGEAGLMSRLLARKLGAFCTFAAADEGRGTAPGQPTLREFKQLYRWDQVGPATRLFGVIGCPVAHSMSPAIHNAAFDAVGFDGLYLPLLVEPDGGEFARLLDGILERDDWLNFRGLSVTIPHKEHALAYVRRCGGKVEPLSERIGAVNTIRFEADGSLTAQNTDYAAAVDSVCNALGCSRADLAGRPIAVLGAGGAARAIVAGFADANASVTVFNRTFERAERLAGEFGCKARPFDDRVALDAEIIINATSIGMHPNTDQSPLPDGVLRAGQVVFDTVYNPVRTRLLGQARAAGARTIDGVAMFVRQAAEQFEFWTGQAAPAEVMRRIVLSRLGG